MDKFFNKKQGTLAVLGIISAVAMAHFGKNHGAVVVFIIFVILFFFGAIC